MQNPNVAQNTKSQSNLIGFLCGQIIIFLIDLGYIVDTD